MPELPALGGELELASVPLERDLTWDAIVTTAERLSDKYHAEIFDHGGEFELHPHRRRSFRRWEIAEGFLLIGYWVTRETRDPDVFEPVRERRMLSAAWHEVQPVQAAAAAIGERLRDWARYLQEH